MAEPDRTGLDSRRERATGWILFALALAARLAYTAFFDAENPLPPGSDANSYDALARAIASGTDWILHPGPALFRPPGYPMVLAVLYRLTGYNLVLVQYLQSILGAASVVLVYALGRRHLGRTPALLAAVWLALNPLHLNFNGQLLRETWLVLLNVGLLASLLARDGLSARGVWRTALVYTVLLHSDSRYIFHLPFFAAYFALAAAGREPAPAHVAPARRRWLDVPAAVKPTLLFVAAVLLFSAPWAIRNALAYDHFVLIDPRALGSRGYRASAAVIGEAPKPGPEMLAQFTAAKEARIDSLSREEQRAFRAGIRPRYGQPAKALFNLVEFWRLAHFKAEYRPLPDGRFAGVWSPEHNLASLLFMGLLLPGFLLGCIRAVRTADRVGLILVAFITVHTLLHVLVHSTTRYRLPVEPFYGLVAFQEMARWAWILTGRRETPVTA